MERIDRRMMLGLVAGAACAPLAPVQALAAAAPLTMWRDPGCGCCTLWAKRVETAFGRKLRVIDSPDMAAVKKNQGVPEDLRSCHTALIDGVVVEGHVPPEEIKRLIASKRKDVRGLAVAGMPAGSPGMDVGHNHKQPYKVIAFSAGGKRSVFASRG